MQESHYGRYNVEISGWDREESFFVEDSVAEWTGPGEKIAYLKRAVREGSLLFVRLLEWESNRDSYPVAYRAQRVSIADARGVRTVRLEPMHSRIPLPQPDESEMPCE